MNIKKRNSNNTSDIKISVDMISYIISNETRKNPILNALI